jgi:CheY-like chemotaxis protein
MSTHTPLIVVVDDDTAVVRLVTDFLEAYDYRTISCVDSADAVSLVESTQPDLVLLDIQMQQWNAGLQVLAALRQIPATSTLPVIICSANLPLLRQQEQHIRALGADILEKPYMLDSVLAKADAALGRPPRPAPIE